MDSSHRIVGAFFLLALGTGAGLLAGDSVSRMIGVGLLFGSATALLALRLWRGGHDEQQVAINPELGKPEHLYRSIINSMAEGVVIQNKRGEIVVHNNSAERILGLTDDQLRGRTSLDPRWHTIHKDGTPFPGDTHPAMVTLRTGEAQHSVIMGVYKPDGSVSWISINSEPICSNDSDKPDAVVCSFHDTTRQQQAEAELREAKERWQFALESVGDGVWDWNLQTGQVYFSPRWKSMLGYGENEIGDSLEEFDSRLHDEDRPRLAPLLNAYIAGDIEEYRAEIRLRCRDGSFKWVLTRGKIISRDDSGKPVRFIGTHTDISERKRLEHMKDEFISTVSHELRTPLTSIHGGIKLAISGQLGALPAPALEILRLAERNSERLNRLVNDILDSQRLESGTVKFTLERVAARELLEAALAADQTMAAQKNCHLQITECADVATVVDRLRFAQVMSNLISNAIKFSPPNQPIELQAVRQSNRLLVSVRDYGAGVPDDFKQKMFERFSQADGADNRSHQRGTGLGLYITKRLVEGMDGKIWFEAQNPGTKFCVEVPLAYTEAVAPTT